MKERRHLTAEELFALAPYEPNMASAVKSDYARGIDRSALRLMKAIYLDVSGSRVAPDLCCAQCIVRLVRTVGRWYFEDVVNF